jgi:hypothetical protein
MYFRFDPSRKSNLKKEIVTIIVIIIPVKMCTFLYVYDLCRHISIDYMNR